MTPTNELRFVERETSISETGEHFMEPFTIRVLQQKWVDETTLSLYQPIYEWRDVPLVKEQP